MLPAQIKIWRDIAMYEAPVKPGKGLHPKKGELRIYGTNDAFLKTFDHELPENSKITHHVKTCHGCYFSILGIRFRVSHRAAYACIPETDRWDSHCLMAYLCNKCNGTEGTLNAARINKLLQLTPEYDFHEFDDIL